MAKKNKGIRLDPALRSALLWLAPSILLRILGSELGWAWFAGLLQVLFYILAGYMAASGYHETIRRSYPKGRPVEEVRSGAKAGITTGILLSVSLVLIGLLVGWLASFGLLALGRQLVLVFLIPLDILGGLFLGALGGKLFTAAGR